MEIKKLFLSLAAVLLLSGCATIVRDSTQSIPIDANTDKVNIKITNRMGRTVFEGQTPAIVSLKTAQNGYFSPEQYVVEASKPGYMPIKKEIDWHVSGWYIVGNLPAWLIGYLVVDPLTGKMYYLDEEIYLNMIPDGRK